MAHCSHSTITIRLQWAALSRPQTLCCCKPTGRAVTRPLRTTPDAAALWPLPVPSSQIIAETTGAAHGLADARVAAVTSQTPPILPFALWTFVSSNTFAHLAYGPPATTTVESFMIPILEKRRRRCKVGAAASGRAKRTPPHRARFAHVAPAAPTATNVANRWRGRATRP